MNEELSNIDRSVMQMQDTKKSDDSFARTISTVRLLVESDQSDIISYRQNLSVARTLLYESLVDYPLCKGKTAKELGKPPDLGLTPDFAYQRLRFNQYANLISDLDLTLSALDQYEKPIFQSWEMTSDVVNPNAMTSEINLTDVMGQGDTEEAITSKPTYYSSDSLSNSNFVSRPVLIYDNTTNNISMVQIDVWDLVTRDPTIRSRLRNWAYFRSDLEIRVVVTGTPFDIGRLYVGYQPYHLKNACLQRYLSTILPGGTSSFLNYLSQSMIFRAIDVSENKPFTFTVPFICHKLKCRLYNGTLAVGSTTPYDDIAGLGAIFITTGRPITSSSPTANSIGIKIYGRLINCELSISTGAQVAIAQSAEFDTGPIEKVSTAVHNFSQNVLEQVPGLETAGKLLTGVSSAVTKAASYYGWSYPILDQHNLSVRNQPFSNGSQVIGTSTAKKISLDPKQAVTSDMSFLGIHDDEMVIQHIASIPSLFKTFTWATNDVTNTIIARIPVTPYCATTYTSIDTLYQPAACAFAAQPFSVWRGDMYYTMDIVCSKYQRGKFRIRYEPCLFQRALIEADPTYTKQYVQVVDIQETSRFSICIPYLKERAWLQASPLAYYVTQSNTTPSIENGYAFLNGYLIVEVVNPLVGPNSEPVSVDVYVHADKLRVQQPSEARLPTRFADFQSMEIDSHSFQGENISCISFINLKESDAKSASLLHFGEEIVSFRSLLKRFHPTAYLDLTSQVATGPRIITSTFTTLPLDNYSITSATPTYSVILENLFGYLRYGFLGFRGSLRKRVMHFSDGFSTELMRTVVATRFNSQPNPTVSTGNIPALTRLDGAVAFVQHTNGGIEFEIPFYSQNLFQVAFARDTLGTNPPEGMRLTWSSGYNVYSEYLGPLSASVVHEETASGEDFSFFGFVASPFFVSFT